MRHVTNIIVVFSKPEDGKNIKGILVRSGFQMVAICTSDAQILSAAEDLNSGTVVGGYRFEDMLYDGLRQYLSGAFDMLLISSSNRWSGQAPGNVICLPMLSKAHDLLNTLEMMVQAQMCFRREMRGKPKERSEEEQDLITRAKRLLMEWNNTTESEAHRYIQKCSMDSGTNLVETAQMVINLIHM